LLKAHTLLKIKHVSLFVAKKEHTEILGDKFTGEFKNNVQYKNLREKKNKRAKTGD
jgi:hypothetical protein